MLTWFRNHSLEANRNKFQLMFLGTKKIIHKCLNIDVKNSRSKTSVLLLGIIIDWKLNFNEHVKLLCAKANAKVKVLYRLRSKLDPRQKLMLYNSFLMSNLNYCPIIWMFYGKTSNEKINNIHRRALRALSNDFNSNYYELPKRVIILTYMK